MVGGVRTILACLAVGLAAAGEGDWKPRPPGPGAVGAATTFAVAGLPPGAEVSWDFGDGVETPFGPAAGTAHVFRSPGRYPVLVRVRADGAETARSFIHVAYRPPTAVSPTRAATIALAGGLVWSVNTDHDAVAVCDARTLAPVREVPVGRRPRSLACASDGTVWVANQEDATVSVLAVTGERLATIGLPPGSQPFGIAIAPDGVHAFVTLHATGAVAKLAVAGRRLLTVAQACPAPRWLAVTADSSRLLVARFVSPAGHGEVVELDAGTLSPVRTLVLPFDEARDEQNDGRGVPNYLGSLAISPDGARAWVPAAKHNTARGLARDGEEMNFENAVRTIVCQLDLALGVEDGERRMDLDNRNLANAVEFSPLGDLAFVSTQGTDTIEVIDANQPQCTVAVLHGAGPAPQGLVYDRATDRLFVHSELGRTVLAYDVAGIVHSTTNVAVRLAAIPTVGRERLAPEVLHGKRLFHSAENPRLSFDGYISCASCHHDGDQDGRVWDFTDRGEGLRNTISLLGRRGTGHGRLHWSANFDELQDFEQDIRGAFGGTGLMTDAEYASCATGLGTPKQGRSTDLDALAAYVASLDRVDRSPHRREDGSPTAHAEAGRAVFQRLDCAGCHGGPEFTDSPLGLRHDVGTLGAASGQRMGGALGGIDTPTLRGVWATAPYLHDGSAATLAEVFTVRDPEGRHRGTQALSPTELRQLVAYLEQIDDREPAAPEAGPAIAFAHPHLIAGPGEPVDLVVSAAPSVREVSFSSGGRLLGTSAAPFRFAWTPPGPGTHVVSATARHASGAVSLAADLTVTVGDGHGLAALYSAGAKALRRVDAAIDFDWKLGAPLSGAFGAVWTGLLTPSGPGPHVLNVEAGSGDSVRVFLDGRLVLTGAGGRASSPSLTLGRAPHALRIEYRAAEAGFLRLSWSSPARPDEVIPSESFIPTTTPGDHAGRAEPSP